MKIEKPVIVVVAYNRVNSLQRLLGSLKRGHYPENTKLIISIDYAPDNVYVVNYAREFEWNSGEKEVISHSENIGLRRHIISCGDLSKKYGSVIILEDDLYVSPFFYDYTLQALDYYCEHEEISGIGLFNYTHIEKVNPEPFNPVVDASDVYFIQYACSWGQAWTHKQWDAFRKWYDAGPIINDIEGISEHVLRWPDSSWKKYFIAYMVLNNKFFVYPHVSLTSNFDDLGTNRTLSTFEVQSILLLEKKIFSYKSLRDSVAVYDAHFEILPEKICAFNKRLEPYDFAVDLYGNKKPDKIKEEFLLTTKKSKSFIHGFTRALKPHEMNIIFDIPGDQIILCNKKDLLYHSRKDKIIAFVSDFNYFYRTTLSFGEVMIFVWYKIFKKLGVTIKHRKLSKWQKIY